VNPALCAALLVAPLAAQGDALFKVDRSVEPPRVSADRNGVSAEAALVALGEALGWTVRFETQQLRDELGHSSLDLAFDDQGARGIAHMVAVAGGGDVVFDDRSGPNGPRTELHVVKAPDGATESGRQRLRQWAGRWYQTFLAEDLRVDPLVVAKASETRMHLGHLLLKLGDVDGARAVFQAVYDADPTHPHVPMALLRLAQCLFDLQRHDEAEQWLRVLVRRHPSLPETAQATVLLGRTLIASGEPSRLDECVALLDTSLLALAGTPQTTDLLLLIAEAHRRRQRLDRTFETMERIAAQKTFRELSHAQWLDYHFLRGAAAEAVGRPAEAMAALETFLGTGESDPRRGQAFVVLGRCYLALGRFLEARASALEACSLETQLDKDWRKEARILEAKAALATGAREKAFEELETEVRRPERRAPELVLFLADAYLEHARWTRAAAAAELLCAQQDEWGDQARYRKALALFRQGETLGNLRGVPQQMIPLAAAIKDERLQRQAAELIGRAWEALGDAERAADAYRGLLR
jgi:tetratricopeptide (TPR) repeat protein